LLSSRYYLNDNKDYVTAIFGLGSIPDDQSLVNQFNNFSQFTTRSAGIGIQKTIHYKTTLNLLVNYVNLQVQSKPVNQFDFYITLYRNF